MHDIKNQETVRCVGSCSNGGLFFGVLLILSGVAFLLGQMDLLGGYSAWQFWPLILVLMGLRRLLFRRRSFTFGILLLGAGGLLQVHNLGIVRVDWNMIWPSLLIGVGLLVFAATLRQKTRQKRAGSFAANPGTSDVHVVMGGREVEISDPAFEGGRLSCVMGGLEMDLRKAQMKGPEAVIDMYLVMGGLELRVPANWSVVLDATPIMGGFDDKTAGGGETGHRLVLKGTLIMGGVEVQN